MSAPLWFQNLFAYCLQIAGLALAGVLLPRALRLRTPRLLYFYWQALLAVCLLLPLLEPWERLETAPGEIAASRILFDLAPAASRLPGFPIAPVILVVLVGGMGLRLGWVALGLTKLTRYRQSARRIEPLPRGIQEIVTRLGVAPEFCLSEEIPGPVTFGLRRPVILVPPRFTELDVDRQQVIASHELLHVVRRDWAFNLAEEIILAVFWFHPVVWWLVGRIRLSREQVVDQQVVELTGARKPYLYALVEIAAGPGAVGGLVAPAFLKECQLAERIRTLIKGDLMSKRRIIISLACVAVLTLLAGLAVIRKFPLKVGGPPPAASNPVQPTLLGPPELKLPQMAMNMPWGDPSGVLGPASNGPGFGGGAYSVGGGVSAPIPIYKPEPAYSEEARKAKYQGTVVLWIIVDAQGNVTPDVRVVKPLGLGLDEKAVEAVKTWKFKPAMKNATPVPVRVMVEVSFRLF